MTPSVSPPRDVRVAVVGGGVAGLATAVAAVASGLKVELFEAQRRLGGRAGSFRDSPSGELVDYCQHVGLGCCTNLADFCRRTGVADCFARHRRLHFFGPRGTRHDFSAAPLLPAPLHLAPGLLRLGYLSLAQRLRIARTLRRLARLDPATDGHDVTIGAWLRQQGESDRAIERFWSVVLVGALSETLEHASLAAARKVIVDGFLASRRAYELYVPRVPLEEIFHRRLGHWLTERDVVFHLDTRVKRIDGDARRADAVVLPDGSRRPFDFVVVAVPWWRVRGVLSEAMLAALPALEGVRRIEPAPITAVHLWFDRPITPLPHAVLVGRLSQWMFNHAGQASSAQTAGSPHHYQVVISASHGLRGRQRQEVVGQVHEELCATWPEARRAQLLHWRMATSPRAVFSVRPGVDRLRPAQETPLANLMLAGDWTSTGWPATMESAVRSGYLAVESILKSSGARSPRRLLVPDLPRSRLALLPSPPAASRGTGSCL